MQVEKQTHYRKKVTASADLVRLTHMREALRLAVGVAFSRNYPIPLRTRQIDSAMKALGKLRAIFDVAIEEATFAATGDKPPLEEDYWPGLGHPRRFI